MQAETKQPTMRSYTLFTGEKQAGIQQKYLTRHISAIHFLFTNTLISGTYMLVVRPSLCYDIRTGAIPEKEERPVNHCTFTANLS